MDPMRVDPFDLSTWYHPDRTTEDPGKPMTRKELAAKLCESTVALQRAQSALKGAQRAAEEAELEQRRLGIQVNGLIATQASKPSDAGEKASSDAAIAFADAIAKRRDSEVALIRARASAECLAEEVKGRLEMLIASGRAYP